jgi:Bacterial CdiA-CT RNAse A domain
MEEGFPEITLPEHFVARHIGIPEEELRLRLVEEGLHSSSSFFDTETARRAIAETIGANGFEIEEWRSQEPRPRLRLDHIGSFPVGIVVRSDQPVQESCSTRIILKPAASPDGYELVTGFPV